MRVGDTILHGQGFLGVWRDGCNRLGAWRWGRGKRPPGSSCQPQLELH